MFELLWHLSEGCLAFFVILIWASLLNCAILFILQNILGITTLKTLNGYTIFAFAGIPWLTASCSLLFIYTPLLSDVFTLQHCHELNCAPHQPSVIHGLLGGFVLSSTFLGFALLVSLLAIRVYRNSQQVAMLIKLSKPVDGKPYRQLPSQGVFAWTVGLFKPQILMSSLVLEKFSRDELELITLHERAHAERFDNLKKFILKLMLICSPSWPRKQFLNQYEELCEQTAHGCALNQFKRRRQSARNNVKNLKFNSGNNLKIANLISGSVQWPTVVIVVVCSLSIHLGVFIPSYHLLIDSLLN